MTETMDAWRQHRYGDPGVVTREEVARPEPGAGEVLLRVRATGLNAGDVRIMRGDPLLVRLAFGLRRPRIATRGMDVAGTVVAIGAGVDAFAVGDEVVGELPGGGLAPYVAAPADRLVRRPAAVDAVSAAALPIAAGTAWQALDLSSIGDGGRVLVIGASGGVGTFAVPLAALRGAEVLALTGTPTLGLVEGLGAARVFDRHEVTPDAAVLPAGGFDAVIDIAGRAPLRVLQRLLRPGGALVLVAGHGGRVLGPMGRMLRGVLLSRRSRRIRMLAARPDTGILSALLELVADGRLRPVVERTWPLEEADDALAHVDAGHTVGKAVVVAA